MAGEKPTNKALQPKWQGTHRPADSIQKLDRCKVVIIGVGDAGNNTITQLTKMGVKEASTIAINTDPLQLHKTESNCKILIDNKSIHKHHAGLGTSKAAMGKLRKQIGEALEDADIAFVTAGLESTAATCSLPVITDIAKKKGTITIGVVTKPLENEKHRTKPAAQAITKLQQKCDTLIVIDNNKLTGLTFQLPMKEVFKIADQVLASVIKNIVDAISTPSLVNLDLAGFRAIVKHGGVAAIGIGESSAPNRAEEAALSAFNSPLLNVDQAAATKALIHISGDSRMTIEEANRIGEIVTRMMNTDAQIIWGANVDPELGNKIRVTLVMTGVNPFEATSDFNSIAPQLFDLDPHSEPEKKLPVDLGLYQLENYEV